MSEHELNLLAPYKPTKREKIPWLKHKRYHIETTVICQLVERFRAKTVGTRDTWHF